jgi:GNAT superfamily N-acetyltransferase
MLYPIEHLTTHSDVVRYQSSLVPLLQSCLNPDPPMSSMDFLAPLTEEQAAADWTDVAAAVGASSSTAHLLVMTGPETVIASAQLLLIPKATHQHRAELARLMVLPEYQGRGLGKTMSAYAERFAKGGART